MPRIKKQVLKQRKDGRYACRYKGLIFMGHTSDEALAAREEYKQRERRGEGQPSRTLFLNYGEQWLHAYKSHLTDAPYNTHVRMLNRFADLIGNLPLTDVRPSDVSRFYQTFAGKSLSTIKSARDTIKGVFRAALADGLIDKDPAADVAIPNGKKGTHREITKQERELIHKTAHRLRPAVMVMLYAGLRRGEAMALQIERDVDFKNLTITVREAVRFESDGKASISSPKTEAGERTVPMLKGLAGELRGLTGLLCPSADGELMTESAWSRAWESYLYALGETLNGCSRRWAKKEWRPVSIRPHDLRHSFCTMLYDSGVDLKTAMLWMGHADQTMTLRIYTHLTETRRAASEKSLRAAQKSAFGMQNGMQTKPALPNPRKNKAKPSAEP